MCLLLIVSFVVLRQKVGLRFAMEGFLVDGIENFLNARLYALLQCSSIFIQLRFDTTLN